MLETYIIGGLTILALLVGPFIGIYTQKWIETKKEHRSKQLDIFRVLLGDRHSNFSVKYIRALNLIPIDFSDKKKKEKPVIIASKTLLNHLINPPEEKDYKNEAEYRNAEQIAEEKESEYRVNLIFELSKCLGYSFEKFDIKGAGYNSTADEEEERFEKKIIRAGIIDLLTSASPLNLNITNLPKKPSGKKAKK